MYMTSLFIFWTLYLFRSGTKVYRDVFQLKQSVFLFVLELFYFCIEGKFML